VGMEYVLFTEVVMCISAGANRSHTNDLVNEIQVEKVTTASQSKSSNVWI
jgi:hypothetical protein